LKSESETASFLNGDELLTIRHAEAHYKRELAEARQQIESLRTQLDTIFANRSKGIDVVSNGIQPALASVLHLSELLVNRSGDLTVEQNEVFVRELHARVRTVHQVAENLMVWGKTLQGEMTVLPKRLNAQAVVQNELRLFASNAELGKISLTESVDPQHYLFADEGQLKYCLRNLVSFALRETQSGGSVKLSASVAVNKLVLILNFYPAQLTPQVVDEIVRFSKPDPDPETIGINLGVYLANEYIKANGGQLDFHTKGQTASFELSLSTTETNPFDSNRHGLSRSMVLNS
jgi:K+-sensing histidine kinase KdpD